MFLEAKRYAPGFVIKNHLTATYLYICAENNSTGCRSILPGFGKSFDITVFYSF